VDAQGAVTLGRDYDPFGGLITNAGSASTNYGFAGEEQDPDSDQIFLRARTYKPGTGRFLQQDSVLGSLNEPRTLHRYTYSFNNPINYTDPAGRMPGRNEPPAPNSYNDGRSGGAQGGNPPYLPNNNPERSANDGRPTTYSDPTPRQQSEGFRPSICGFVQTVQAAVDLAGDVAQEVLEFTEPFQDWIDPLQERLYNAVKDTAFIQELQRDARNNPVESMLAAVLLDWAYDLTSVILGHDLMTGQKLSHGEELLAVAAIAIPVVSVAAIKLGPKLLKAGGRLAGSGDELLDAAKWSARYGDDLANSQTIARRLDEYVTRTDPTIQRRLDDWVARSDDLGNRPPHQGLPGREVDLDEASEFSGIPKEYLDDARKVSDETNTICGLRQCNPKMDELRTTTWPKDTGAKVYHPVTGEKLKISSDAPIKFKTNEHGLVSAELDIGGKAIEYSVVRRPDGSFKLIDMEDIVQNGKITLDPRIGIPMGPDVDTNFFLKIEGGSAVNLGTGTPGELHMRARLAYAMSDSRAGVDELVSAIGHGTGQPYFGTVETWGDTLVILPDGRFIALQENEIEAFFNYYGLTTYKKGPDGGYLVSNFVKDYDQFFER